MHMEGEMAIMRGEARRRWHKALRERMARLEASNARLTTACERLIAWWEARDTSDVLAYVVMEARRAVQESKEANDAHDDPSQHGELDPPDPGG